LNEDEGAEFEEESKDSSKRNKWAFIAESEQPDNQLPDQK
jgi:hypothetical protein